MATSVKTRTKYYINKNNTHHIRHDTVGYGQGWKKTLRLNFNSEQTVRHFTVAEVGL